MRWLREWRNPALKCQRLGHATGLEFRKGYRRPDFDKGEHRHYVCVSVYEDRPACLRCEQPLGDWRQVHRRGFNSYSWPGDQAEKFETAGEYWTSHGFVAT